MDSLKSMHLFIYTINIDGAPVCYLVPDLGEAEEEERHREGILNSVSLNMKAAGTIYMPTSECHHSQPTRHSFTHSFPHSLSKCQEPGPLWMLEVQP